MEQQDILPLAEAALNSLHALCELWPNLGDQYKAGNLLAEDQLGRFRIWADNIGVFAKGHANLDYRLRESKEVHLLMVEQLETLQTSVQRAIEISHPDTYRDREAQERSDIFSIHNGSSQASSSAISSSFHGTDTDSLVEILDLTPFQQRMYAIEQAIDRLFRLSMAIRRHSLGNQDQRAAKFVMTDDEGNANTDVFEQYANARIRHQFPDAPFRLVEKLATAITFRRRRFLYRDSHQHKLSSHTLPRTKSSVALPVLNTQERSTIVGQRSQVTLQPTVRNAKKYHKPLKNGLPSTTTASLFQASKFNSGSVINARSTISTSFAPVLESLASLPIPNAPQLATGSKEFECPYCCIMLPIEEAKGASWRRHVMNDLEPYVCLSEDCQSSELLFKDRGKWLEHVKSAHTVEWTCKVKSHSPFSTSSEQNFEDHMRSEHAGSFTERQLPLLKRRSQKSASAIFTSCAFCAYVPSQAEVNKEAILKGSSSSTSSTQLWLQSEVLAKHIAAHLELIATIALPWHDDVKDDPSEKSSSGHVEDGTRNDELEEEPIEVNDGLPSFNLDDDCELARLNAEEMWSNIVAKYTDNTEHDASKDNEWQFIETHEYFGHARDPVLQTFLKDLYLSSTAASFNASGPHLPCHLMQINPSEDFFARTFALNAIADALCPSQVQKMQTEKALSFPRSFAVYAPGGMGKTQVAAKFVTTHQHEFDAIFWVHADTTTKISQDFKYIAIKLGLVSEDSVDARDFEYALHAVRRWLIKPVKNLADVEAPNPELASWLLVLDGVEDPSILNNIWPYNGPGSVLITSRSPFSWTQSIQLRPFSSEQAIAFLLHLTERESTEQERRAVVDISEQLGGLPLALTQMAGIMIHKKMSFRDFLESWSVSKLKLLQTSEGSLAPRSTGYEHTLASVWAFENLSYGRTLLDIISILDPDGIPEFLLNGKINPSSFTESSQLWNDYKTARDELVTCSIVSRDKGEKRLFIHRLVQQVARARMTPVQLRANFMACVRLLCAVWPFEKFSWRHNITRWSLCEKLFSQVFRLKEVWHEIPEADEFVRDEFQFARLLTAAGWYHHERGRSVEANIFNDVAEAVCAKLEKNFLPLPGSELILTSKQLDAVVAEIQHNRGCIATEINRPHDALLYQQRFNSMMAKELGSVKGGSDMRLAISWNELGNAWMLNRHWKRAEECFEESIRIMRTLESYEKIWISLPLVNLGLAFWLQGSFDIATEKLLEGYNDRQERFGNDDHESFITGRFLHALGNVKASQGQLDEAQRYHHEALLHNKLTLGNNHHRTADALVKVTDHHLRLGQNDIALALLDHSLKMYESTNNHETYVPEKARALFKRQRALRTLNKPKEANVALEDCYKLYCELFDQDLALIPLSPRSSSIFSSDACSQSAGSESENKQKRKKASAQDLVDADFDELITFWSK